MNTLAEEQYVLLSKFFDQNWPVLRVNPLKVCIRKFSIVIQPNLLNDATKKNQSPDSFASTISF